MKLTEKQKRFADYYIETGNVTEAARKAGYKQPHVQGSQTLEKLSVKKYIEGLLAEKDTQRIADQDEVLQYLTNVMRGEMVEKVLVGAGKGFQVQEDMEVSAKDRIKAAELLGKRYTLWTDGKKIEANIGVTIVDDIDEN